MSAYIVTFFFSFCYLFESITYIFCVLYLSKNTSFYQTYETIRISLFFWILSTIELEKLQLEKFNMKWMKLYLLYLLFKYLLFWCSQRLSHCSSFVLYFCLILSTIESEKLLLEIGDRIWMELYLFYLLFKYLLFCVSEDYLTVLLWFSTFVKYFQL